MSMKRVAAAYEKGQVIPWNPAKEFKGTQLPDPLPLPKDENIKYEIGEFKNRQGVSLRCRRWQDTRSPARGVVVVIHGLGTHLPFTFSSVDYKFENSSIERYVKLGFDVVGQDHQSMGLSDGVTSARCHVKKFSDLSDDLALFLSLLREEYPRSPIIVHGACFGAAVALKMLLEPDCRQLLDACVFTAPLVKGDEEAKNSGANKIILPLLACVSACCPTLPVGSMGEANPQFPELNARFDNDETCYHGMIRARMGKEILDLLDEFALRLNDFEIPMIILHSKNDGLADPAGSMELYREATSKDKSLELVDDMFHDLLLEPGADGVFELIADWLDSRVANGKFSSPLKDDLPRRDPKELWRNAIGSITKAQKFMNAFRGGGVQRKTGLKSIIIG